MYCRPDIDRVARLRDNRRTSDKFPHSMDWFSVEFWLRHVDVPRSDCRSGSCRSRSGSITAHLHERLQLPIQVVRALGRLLRLSPSTTPSCSSPSCYSSSSNRSSPSTSTDSSASSTAARNEPSPCQVETRTGRVVRLGRSVEGRAGLVRGLVRVGGTRVVEGVRGGVALGR